MAFLTENVRAVVYDAAMDDFRQERRRARWRRNKAAARARARPKTHPPSPAFVARVLAERDRRERARWLWDHPELGYWKRRDLWVNAGSWGGRNMWIEFVADVWTARTLLEKEFGAGKATPTRIARWLMENDRRHGYAESSLRPKVYQARAFVEAIEALPRGSDDDQACWAPWEADA
jgi:hypothetical protein